MLYMAAILYGIIMCQKIVHKMNLKIDKSQVNPVTIFWPVLFPNFPLFWDSFTFFNRKLILKCMWLLFHGLAHKPFSHIYALWVSKCLRFCMFNYCQQISSYRKTQNFPHYWLQVHTFSSTAKIKIIHDTRILESKHL